MDPAEAVGQLISPEGRVDPYPIYAALREHGPVVTAGEDFLVVTGHAAADDLLRDPRLVVLDDALRDQMWPEWRESPAVLSISRSMLRSNPPDHTRMRRLAAGTFTPRRIAGMRGVVAALAGELVRGMADRGRDGTPVDFMAEFAYPLPVGVICALLGVPAADRPWFRQRAADLTAVLELDVSPQDRAAADKGATDLLDYFAELVRARRRNPADDLTTALVQAHDGDGDRLSSAELLANLVVLLVAGFETTTNLFGNGLAVLLREPEHAAALRADPDRAPRYVTEMLRYDSPVQLTSRVASTALSCGSTPVPAGAGLLVLLGAANRDPARFTHPERFDPDREHNHPLSFGGGPHYCLGAALARLEAEVAFPLLLRELPGLDLAGEPVRRTRLTLRGYAALPVRVG
ncbi:cytochrome P450 [Plantactinospora siamensis]|uniref:Cytochrome P450 n=1 Tax=Plantactinospora siamensis TaxID=555372 RepID=A0ABV6P1A6_9ACTN